MAAPSLGDGIVRAIEELAVPCAVLFGIVGVVRIGYGQQAAGFAYTALLGIVLLEMYSDANYWNIKYTFGFVAAGLPIWVGVPGSSPTLPHLSSPKLAR